MLNRTVFAAACSIALVLGSLAVGVATIELAVWDPWLFVLLLALVVGADLQQIKVKSLSVSGNFVGLVLAMALLGPLPAAVLGILSNTVWIVRDRPRLAMAMVTVSSYAVACTAGSLVMAETSALMGVDQADLAYVVPLIGGFAVAHVLNFGIVLAGSNLVDGERFWGLLRTVIVPLLPSDVAMALLASLLVFAETQLGPLALGMFIGLFGLYMYLYRELILSQQRAEELGHRTEQLASLQVGVLTTLLRTLAMRDHMTARHSAAVARYTREIARAAGLSADEQDLAHTAGLLHDIGKFILPDHILLANTKLDDHDWQTIRMHPYQGSKVVREVEGYGPVADIIWCHHERIDGKGYPRGIAGDDIPVISRIISIADTYDVMTARDSYRDPVSSQAAIDELRRVSGSQLDGDLVEVFIALLDSKGLAFRHADDADFEAELSFERRVRDYAAPRAADLPQAA